MGFPPSKASPLPSCSAASRLSRLSAKRRSTRSAFLRHTPSRNDSRSLMQRDHRRHRFHRPNGESMAYIETQKLHLQSWRSIKYHRALLHNGPHGATSTWWKIFSCPYRCASRWAADTGGCPLTRSALRRISVYGNLFEKLESIHFTDLGRRVSRRTECARPQETVLSGPEIVGEEH